MDMTPRPPTPQWLIYALASGGCAALNGVFAKLTTTQLTTTWAKAISRHVLGMQSGEESVVVEGCVRGFFFLMNLAFNAVMWGLFTNALRLASSTVRVSVINTSANFLVTAILGWVVFEERLPALWFLGASFLIAGSVIIGTRDESSNKNPNASGQEPRAADGSTTTSAEVDLDIYSDEPDAPPPSVGRTSTKPARSNGDVEGGAYDYHSSSEGEDDEQQRQEEQQAERKKMLLGREGGDEGWGRGR